MDKQIESACHPGILSKHNTSHTSPVMLITWKVTNGQMACSEFLIVKYQNLLEKHSNSIIERHFQHFRTFEM